MSVETGHGSGRSLFLYPHKDVASSQDGFFIYSVQGVSLDVQTKEILRGNGGILSFFSDRGLADRQGIDWSHLRRQGVLVEGIGFNWCSKGDLDSVLPEAFLGSKLPEV